jgi:hypothetical protein
MLQLKIAIAVLPKALNADGFEIEGEAEVLQFTEEELVDVLRHQSTIPAHEQRHWQVEEVSFS